MNVFQSIGIIGMGNVGSHLATRLIEVGYKSIFVLTSKKQESIQGITVVQDYSAFNGCELIICAVPDAAMEVVLCKAAAIAPSISISGTFLINHLNSKHEMGTWYPLISFVKDQQLSWNNIPVFIHSKDKVFEEKLIAFAKQVSGNGIVLAEEKRKNLHLAAVFANNFTTHLYDLAAHWCEDNHLDFEWLKPLISQQITTLLTEKPHQLQTGPAKRNDQNTIQEHLSMLPENLQELYRLLTNSIINHYQKK